MLFIWLRCKHAAAWGSDNKRCDTSHSEFICKGEGHLKFGGNPIQVERVHVPAINVENKHSLSRSSSGGGVKCRNCNVVRGQPSLLTKSRLLISHFDADACHQHSYQKYIPDHNHRRSACQNTLGAHEHKWKTRSTEAWSGGGRVLGVGGRGVIEPPPPSSTTNMSVCCFGSSHCLWS